jgi:hypothetical protein
MKCKNNQYGSTFLSDELIPVEISENYKISMMAKTLTNNYLGNPGSGYFGFDCIDRNGLRIFRNQLYREGATTLTRDVTQGDSNIYIADTSSWYQAATFASVQMRLLIYPSDHPDYGTPYEYSRIEYFYDGTNITWTGTDFQLPIVDSAGSPSTIGSNVTGYNTTIGTPVGNSWAGATYQYLLGANIDLSSDWKLYSGDINGTGSSGGARNYPEFRYGTKYVRFLSLLNHKYRTQTSGDSATFLMDNFMLLKMTPGKTYKNTVFQRRYT